MNHDESRGSFSSFLHSIHPTHRPSTQCQRNEPPTMRRSHVRCRSNSTTWAAPRHSPGEDMRHKTRATTFVVVRFRHRPTHSSPQTTPFPNACVKNKTTTASDHPSSGHRQREAHHRHIRPLIDKSGPLSTRTTHHRHTPPTKYRVPHIEDTYRPTLPCQPCQDEGSPTA